MARAAWIGRVELGRAGTTREGWTLGKGYMRVDGGIYKGMNLRHGGPRWEGGVSKSRGVRGRFFDSWEVGTNDAAQTSAAWDERNDGMDEWMDGEGSGIHGVHQRRKLEQATTRGKRK